jgi:DNA-binding transcriptional regulator YbjK
MTDASATDPPEDRRLQRGAERRRQILTAALRVIAQRGIGDTTHRAIAAEADIPSSVTTYHFRSIDELLEAALRLFVDEEVARLREATAAVLEPGVTIDRRAIVDGVLAVVTSGVGAQTAQFELYLEAARRPGLAGVARACMDAYVELGRTLLESLGAEQPRQGAHALLAIMEGLSLQRLVYGGEDFEGEIAAPAVLAVVEAFAPERR